MTFKELYESVAERVGSQQPNNLVKSGTCMAIIESKSGNVYYGVDIIAANGLGVSAERAAVYNMVAFGDFEIDKIVIVDEDKNVRMPSGDCRELMMQLSKENGQAGILVDVNKLQMIKLEKLLPLWWGANKY